MLVTTLLKKLLGIKQLFVSDVDVEDGMLVVDVRPSWRIARCSGCGELHSTYDTQAARRWRHLDFGGVRVLLRYAPRRVDCPRCGVVVEKVPWASSARGGFTSDFEQAVAFLAQRTDKTSVVEMFGIAWVTVGRIVGRVVEQLRPDDPLHGLRYIGVDEISYRKGHRYLTTVTDHDSGRIVWAAEGKNADTLKAFFDELGEERCKDIEVVSMDMSKAYIKAAEDRVPNAQIVFDRFHVQQLVNTAVDETRRAEWQRLRELDGQQAKAVKGLRWPLLKNPWNLSPSQQDRLSSLQQDNARLYRAYLLKESFRDILDRRQPNVVKRKLEDWLSWASRSRLPGFVKVARTIREHLDDIVAYVRLRITNGVVEGLNNKARVITRRAYGFHSASAFIGLLMLCCTGLWLGPVRKSIAF